MHRLLRWMGWCFAVLSACCVLGVLVFDLTVARPLASRIEGRLHVAAPSERQPPVAMREMLRRAYGARINHLVAREALLLDQPESMGRWRRQFAELGIAWLLPAHLSATDVASAYLAGAYMGPDVRGFAAASRVYLGAELDKIDQAQAARLVALAQAPNIYRQNPERLERKARQLLSLAGQPG